MDQIHSPTSPGNNGGPGGGPGGSDGKGGQVHLHQVDTGNTPPVSPPQGNPGGGGTHFTAGGRWRLQELGSAGGNGTAPGGSNNPGFVVTRRSW